MSHKKKLLFLTINHHKKQTHYVCAYKHRNICDGFSKKVIKISNNIETDDALNGVGVFIIILYIFSYEILQKVHVFYYNIFSC